MRIPSRARRSSTDARVRSPNRFRPFRIRGQGVGSNPKDLKDWVFSWYPETRSSCVNFGSPLSPQTHYQIRQRGYIACTSLLGGSAGATRVLLRAGGRVASTCDYCRLNSTSCSIFGTGLWPAELRFSLLCSDWNYRVCMVGFLGRRRFRGLFRCQGRRVGWVASNGLHSRGLRKNKILDDFCSWVAGVCRKVKQHGVCWRRKNWVSCAAMANHGPLSWRRRWRPQCLVFARLVLRFRFYGDSQ